MNRVWQACIFRWYIRGMPNQKDSILIGGIYDEFGTAVKRIDR